MIVCFVIFDLAQTCNICTFIQLYIITCIIIIHIQSTLSITIYFGITLFVQRRHSCRYILFILQPSLCKFIFGVHGPFHKEYMRSWPQFRQHTSGAWMKINNHIVSQLCICQDISEIVWPDWFSWIKAMGKKKMILYISPTDACEPDSWMWVSTRTYG